MSRDEAFRSLRLAEVDDAIELLRCHGKGSGALLEVGAGTGWQARALSEAGYRVEAIDLPAGSAISGHALNRHWPIHDYDGVHIPFPDASFDIIYSSNVLEHVERLDELMGEMKRILKTGGVALHLLPNPQWRLLSLLTYYPGQAVDLVSYLRRRFQKKKSLSAVAVAAGRQSRNMATKILARLVPPTHGAVGNPLSEIRRYGRSNWDRYFRERGWEIVAYSNNGLLASGDYLLGSAFGIGARRKAGQAVGGIAHVYLLRPAQGNAQAR